MKRFFVMCIVCVLLSSMLLVPHASAAFDSSTITSKRDMDGTVLLADYPADEYASSFVGQANGSYAELYSYENVGVIVHNQRHTIFGDPFDEILFLNNNYGPIRKAELVSTKDVDGAYLTVRMRFRCDSRESSGPQKWIVDVVKIYSGEYYFMFVVARDANGKDYSEKVNTLINSLRLKTYETTVEEDPEDDSNEGFFAPFDAE